MPETNVRPTVSEILNQFGVRPAELVGAAPDVSPHTLRAIMWGRVPGTSHARMIAEAMHALAEAHGEVGRGYEEAALAIDRHYPPAPEDDEPPGELDEDADILHKATKPRANLSAIAREHGISRQAVEQRLVAYERRTGRKILRHRKG